MIPLQLHIAGFLSYRDPIELDFTTFELACISGQNGAGKSSLLDAMTWVLFGEARGKSSDIINLNQDVKAAEVALTFQYENNVYRVQRSLPRNKSTVLEFQIKGDDGWRPLSERTTRETQARIEQTLRLDYETFVNASFFLQGRADQFTQHNAGKRKEVLGSILGLEVWETYKERTAAKRKLLEADLSSIEGRVSEIDVELAEEDTRKARLIELDTRLKELSSTRAAQESLLENMKKVVASLEEQRKLAVTLSLSLERSRSALGGLQTRFAEKEAERATFADLVDRAREVESAYKAWQKSRAEVEKMDAVASQFREHDERRQPLLREIEAERARLEQELKGLHEQEKGISEQLSAGSDLEEKIRSTNQSLAEIEEKLSERGELEKSIVSARERQAELKTENERLRIEMDELKSRIDKLQVAEGAVCPLCGQELSESHRKSTLKELQAEGRLKGDRHRANATQMKTFAEEISDNESRVGKLSQLDSERLAHSNTISQLTERFESLQKQSKEWEKTGSKRIRELVKLLDSGKFASDAQKELVKLDKELVRLGYDAAAHDAARQAEIEGRSAEEDHSNLKTARELSRQIEGEITNLQTEIENRKSEIAQQQKDHDTTASALADAEAQSPNLDEAERELFRLREQENLARDEVGMARQRVDVLSTLRARKVEYDAQREDLQKQIAQHKTLERAFGKDGVPALLIEQALPQIESRANDLLDRLSDGQMSIRFVTQAEYKDKKRDDLKETLDIQISDSAGIRAYEMYSGGEAFRVNFAVRLALSEILAQRKGARLQTLVIDEGFGSQDTQGRQRLIEAINIVKHDFAKILVITHLDELKDAFPNRIEVEKTERGSTIRVI
jgi:exonuclease SbcC